MQEEVPNFSDEKIAQIVKEHYGLEGKISSFVSFEDQNALITTPGERYVLKIANKRWLPEFVKMQTDVLDHLKKEAPNLTVPSVIKTSNGDDIISVDGFLVRLLNFLQGELLTNIPRTPDLYQDVGRFLGQFSEAMKTFSPEATEGSDPLWKLDNVIACKEYLPEVIDEDARDRITRLFEYYEKNIMPKLPHLRKAVIHGDANEQNFLINPAEPTIITGLIDFGELQFSSQINDLAITLAYGLLGEDDIEMASSQIIKGYEREFAILDEEREILYYLMAMRLVTNITMTSHTAKLFPENEYILIAQKPAQELLNKLEQEKYILA
ncbi:MAG: phosphotransferase [Kordiimonadaceae bacterium]|jgi:Ser/Thr protein kinase RdoA (MazF antagonist)|nr:phosphotransferase [Kordiimonadaceae bacterium]MBT6034852.1 phosphotransferase [Kordiimonadaceae bacterium]MBT6330580.1 phosphotransferase [Kordiimonadaceae bacterium]